MRTSTILILLTLLLAACGVNDPLEVAAPQVVGMYPEPGSADVDVVTSVWATFDAAVDPAWAEGSFTLTDALGTTTVVDASYNESTYTVTLTPSAPLAYDAVYEAAFVLAFGVQSSLGALAEDVSWSFSTRAAATTGEPGEETGGASGGDTGGTNGGESGLGAGGTGNTGAGDAVEACNAGSCTFENVDLGGMSVPANEIWTLTNVTIDGPFEIGPGAVVHATNLVVNGKLEATGATDLVFMDTTVTGKVEIKNGGTVHLTRMAVGEHLELTGNYGAGHVVSSNVQLHFEVEVNTGGVELVGNTAGTHLACTGNAPAPTGSGNSATGSVSGQCVGL